MHPVPNMAQVRLYLEIMVANFGVLILDFLLPVAGSCQTCFRSEFRLPVDAGIHLSSCHRFRPQGPFARTPCSQTWNLPFFCLFQSINVLREYGRTLNHYTNYTSLSRTTGRLSFSLFFVVDSIHPCLDLQSRGAVYSRTLAVSPCLHHLSRFAL